MASAEILIRARLSDATASLAGPAYTDPSKVWSPMWPFHRGARRRRRDLLLDELDLAGFAPFTEAERYLLVFPVAVGFGYVLVVVYQAGGGQRVHVAHSPGLQRGSGMWNFVEWIATGVRRRDPHAVALLTSWPPDTGAGHDLLTRCVFAPRAGGRASPGTTVLLDQAGEVENVLTRDQDCLYADPSFSPKLTAQQWSSILGCPVRQFSTAEWQTAADAVDPEREIRDHADRESEQRWAVAKAFYREMGVWDD